MHYPKDLAKADTDTQNSVAVASLNVPSTDLTSTNKCQANNNSEYQCPGVLLLNSMQIRVDARLHVHFCECVHRCMLMCVLTCFSCRLLALCLMGVSGGWTTASLLLCPAVPQPLNSYQLEESGGHTHTHKHTNLPALSPSLLVKQEGRVELLLTAARHTLLETLEELQ